MPRTPVQVTIFSNSVGAADGDTPADPLRDAQSAFIDNPAAGAVGGPNEQFLGGAALDAARGRASLPAAASNAVPLSFTLDNQKVTMRLTPENFSDVLLALYTAGGWEWVHQFAYAAGRRIFPAFVAHLTPEQIARQQVYARVAGRSFEDLNRFIADALVAMAERAAEKMRELAETAAGNLALEEVKYGIRKAAPPTPSGLGTDATSGQDDSEASANNEDQSGAGGGGGADTGNPNVQKYVSNPQIAGADKDLVTAIQQLAKAYTDLERLQGTPEKALLNDAAPPPDPPDPEKIRAASAAFSKMLQDALAQHRLAPGILAVCLPKRPSDDAVIDEQTVFASTVEYLAMSRASLAGVPAKYDSAPLREALRKTLRQLTRRLEGFIDVHLDETPETRAAVFAGGSDRRTAFEPLLADQVLERVRADMIAAAKSSANDDAKVRAGFSLAVLNSYLSVSDAREAIPRARASKDALPFIGVAKASSALSLVGLLIPPLGIAGAVVGGIALVGDALNQFNEVARTNAELDFRALDALLTDDQAAFARSLAAKPRGMAVIGGIVTSLAGFALVGRYLPRVGLAVQVVSDAHTLLE